MNLEEYLAYYQSGGRGGYWHLGEFVTQHDIVTGMNIPRLVDSLPSDADNAELALRLSEATSLGHAFEFQCLGVPSPEHPENGPPTKTRSEFDDFLVRAAEEVVAREGWGPLMERVDAALAGERPGVPDDLASWSLTDYREGTPTVTRALAVRHAVATGRVRHGQAGNHPSPGRLAPTGHPGAGSPFL